MSRPIPPATRWWIWTAGDDMDLRDWVDFVLVVAFIVGATWGVGTVL